MKIIGVTGSSGSGKTTLCNILKDKYKAEVINADMVAKELTQKPTMYLNCIIDYFGTNIIYKNGSLNRKKLANIIYDDVDKREELNKLTFLYVVDEIKKKINGLNTKKLIVIDAPLLFESNLNQICDFVICIISDNETKLKRICKRDNIDIEIAIKRLTAQKQDEFYKENSDYIIDNNNEIKYMEKQLEKINI